MKRAWKCSGLLVVAALAGNASAQGPVYPAGPQGCHSYPSPLIPYPSAPSPSAPSPSAPSLTAPRPDTPATTQPAPSMDQGAGQPTSSGQGEGSALAGLGGAAEGFNQGNVSPAGAGLTAATTGTTAGGSSRSFTSASTNFNATPLILPGLFTAINAESARPMNRVFMSYGYFDSFKVVAPVPNIFAGAVGPTTRTPGFNLNRWDVGAELAFLDGRASAYVRVPYLYAANNSSGAPIDGFGDISAGIKAALLLDRETGSALTAGMTVSAPTARDLVVTTNAFTLSPGSNPAATLPGTPAIPGTTFPTVIRQTVNPTFLQPWVAGLLVLDRLFVQEYFGVVIPTDDSVSTFINNDLALGYQVYRSDCPDRLLTTITPFVDAQMLLPLNHQGTPASAGPVASTFPGAGVAALPLPPAPVTLNSPYQVFLSGGVQIGLGCRALLSTTVVTPVTGPKAYTVGGTVGFNLFF